jgi:transcriptional regulator with XRE-family HTH domain
MSDHGGPDDDIPRRRAKRAERRTAAAFGAKVRELRTAAGLTQAQVAERTDLHPATISRLEGGTLDPAWSVVLKLCDLFHVSPGVFRGEE